MLKNKWMIYGCMVISFFIGVTVLVPLISSKTIVASQYNQNPDNSKKVIGSKEFRETAYMMPSDDLNDLLSASGSVIIGRIVDEPVTKEYYIDTPVEIKEKYGDDVYNSVAICEMSYTTIKVDKVIYSNGIDKDTKTIQFVQHGVAGSDNLETKVKKGDKMLFFLSPFMSEENTYQCTRFEESMFYLKDLKDKEVLTSLSDESYVAKYDGIELKTLIKDLKQAEKVKKNINKFHEK